MKIIEIPVKAVPMAFGLVVFASLLGFSACEDREIVSEKPSYDVSFIGSSSGLPVVGQWRHGIDFFDMNLDGNLDILSPPPRKTPEPQGEPVPRVWYGNGKGEWSRAGIEVPMEGVKYAYGDICGGDFDGDGIPDMGLAMHGVGMRVLKGMGHGKYGDFSKPLAKQHFMSRALVDGDFDGDGHLDIAAVSEGRYGDDYPKPNGVAIMAWKPQGWQFGYVAKKGEALGLEADQLDVGDVNGDGNADIAVASLAGWKDLIIWVNDGAGQFTPFNEGLPKEKLYLYVTLVDFNKDGKDDLIASITGFGKGSFVGLKAFVSGPEGFEDFSEGLPSKEAFQAVTACDLNKDGNIEIIGATQKGGIKIYGLKGDNWTELKVDGLPGEGLERPYGVYCVDVNDDGYMDIGVNYAGYGTDKGGIQVFLNVPGIGG